VRLDARLDGVGADRFHRLRCRAVSVADLLLAIRCLGEVEHVRPEVTTVSLSKLGLGAVLKLEPEDVALTIRSHDVSLLDWWVVFYPSKNYATQELRGCQVLTAAILRFVFYG
jgi:hypothetical protein